MSGPSSPNSVSSSSDVSPMSLPEDKYSYFLPLSSPRLDSIQELGENIKSAENDSHSRQASVSSITFLPSPLDSSKPRGQPKHHKGRIRTSSPPAPSRFQHHVSFDNFAGGEPTERNTISFTLNVKHKGYSYKKRSRTFMVGIDENTYSDYALQWMLEELVDDGDEIVCLRVVDKDAKISSDKSLGRKEYREEARILMQAIQARNDENRAISIVLEFAAGKVHTTFQKMIQLYQPAMLIVGTRGRSLGGLGGLVSNRNSFSKWCLQCSPIPVVVVRPTEKRDKKKLKRSNDPTRQTYLQILQDSGQTAHEADATSAGSIKDAQALPQNTPDIEAHEVAAALGLPAKFDPTLKPINLEGTHYQVRKLSGQGDVRSAPRASASPSGRPSSPMAVLKSPKSADLESPMMSEVESDSEDEAEFETVPAHMLLGKREDEAVEKQKKLHQMEVGEAAALAAGRRASIASLESNGSASGGIERRDDDDDDGDDDDDDDDNDDNDGG